MPSKLSSNLKREKTYESRISRKKIPFFKKEILRFYYK